MPSPLSSSSSPPLVSTVRLAFLAVFVVSIFSLTSSSLLPQLATVGNFSDYIPVFTSPSSLQAAVSQPEPQLPSSLSSSSPLSPLLSSPGYDSSSSPQNTSSEDKATYSGPEWYLVPLFFGIIFVVGTTGNCSLIFTVLRHKEMRTAPNYLLVSLAIGDFLLILISVPLNSTLYTFKSWPYGQFACKLSTFLETLSLGVTVFTLTALSWERYSVIVNPMKASQRKPVFRTMAVVVGVWTLAAGLAAVDQINAGIFYPFSKDAASNGTDPEKINSSFNSEPICTRSTQMVIDATTSLTATASEALKQPESVTYGFCYRCPTPQWDPCKYLHLVQFIIYLAVPLIIITGFYVVMAKVLFASGKYLQQPGGSLRQNSQERQSRASDIKKNGRETSQYGDFQRSILGGESDKLETDRAKNSKWSDEKQRSEIQRTSRSEKDMPSQSSEQRSEKPRNERSSRERVTTLRINDQMAKQIEARKKVAKLVLLFVVAFAVCWLPYYIYFLWYDLIPGTYNEFWHNLKIVGFCMSFTNSCVNPLALYFLSKQYRKYYQRYFYFFCRCCKPPKHGSRSTKRDDDDDYGDYENDPSNANKIKMSRLINSSSRGKYHNLKNHKMSIIRPAGESIGGHGKNNKNRFCVEGCDGEGADGNRYRGRNIFNRLRRYGDWSKRRQSRDTSVSMTPIGVTLGTSVSQTTTAVSC